MSAPFLEAQSLHAWYGSSHVLHGIDIHIAAGETVGLLGRNGMGKSTLIRTLLGHVTQREGRIAVAGKDMSRARAATAEATGLTSACLTPSRGCRSGSPTSARNSRAASSRCCRSAAR